MWTEKDQLEDFLINMVLKDSDGVSEQNYIDANADDEIDEPEWGAFCDYYNLGDGIYDLGTTTKGFEFNDFWEKFKKEKTKKQ